MRSTSPTTVMVGIFAILFGLAAAYGVRVAMMPKPEPPAAPAPVVRAPKPIPMRTVIMAKKNLEPFTYLSSENLTEVKIPEEIFQKIRSEAGSPDAFPFENLALALNRVTSTKIMAGNWITNECLCEFGKIPTIEDKLQPGELAMAIPISPMASIAGFIHPDALVNISWMPNGDSVPGVSDSTVVTVYQNVRVLSTNSELFENNSQKPRTVSTITLAVTQEMANALNVLQQKGSFSIAMGAEKEGEAASHERCTDPHSNIYGILGIEPPEATVAGTAYTDAWVSTQKIVHNFNTSEVLEAHNATRVVMNKLKPLKKLPKRSMDPDTMVVE